MQTILWAALSNTIIAALIGAVAAGVYRFSRRPALAHALWVIVLIKLITPPLYAVPILKDSSVPVERVAVQTAHVPTAFVANADVSTVGRREFGLASVVLLIWVLGSVAFGAVTVLRLSRFRRILGHARRADEDADRLTREVGRRIGLRRLPEVYFLPGRVCPMLWATPWRARLLLPEQLWGTMGESGREKLIAHELAHLYRGDHRVRWLEIATTIVCWWNPVLWMARRGLHEAEEDCCDAWVARLFSEDRDEYASALLSAIEFADPPRTPVMASGVGSFRSLKRRLFMIQAGGVFPRAGRVGVACACLMALLIPLTYGRAQAPKVGASSQPAATQTAEDAVKNAEALKKLDRTLPALQFDGVGFADVIDFLRDVSGAGIVVRWEELEKVGIDRNTPVSLNVRNDKFGDALTMVLVKAAGKPGVISYGVSRGQVVILPVGHNPELANLLTTGTKVDGAMQAKLNQKLSLTYTDVGLADILDDMQKAAGVKIVVPWDKLKAAGVDRSKRLTLNFREESFSDALSAVLTEAARKAGVLAFTVEKGDIVVVVKGTSLTPSKK